MKGAAYATRETLIDPTYKPLEVKTEVTDTEKHELPSAKRDLVERYEALDKALREPTTGNELFKLVSHPDWRAMTQTLAPNDLTKLRKLYVQRKQDLDGRAKLEEFDDQILSIVDIQFWHTDKYQNNDGAGVTLTYHPESDPTRTCRSMTSSSIVYRFATRACDPYPPTESDPIRAHVKLIPVRDPERAAQGQRQWQFRELPTLTRANGEEGAPF